MLVLQNRRCAGSEPGAARAGELLPGLLGKPRQPSRGRCCFGAVLASIPIPPYRHSSEHTEWPQEKRRGMKQTRVLHFNRCFLCTNRTGLQAKRGCPALRRIPFCLSWAGVLVNLLLIFFFFFVSVLIVGCFYIFCGLAAPSLRARCIRCRQDRQHAQPAGCRTHARRRAARCWRARSGSWPSLGWAGLGRRAGSGHSCPAPERAPPHTGRQRLLRAPRANGRCCRQPIRAGRCPARGNEDGELPAASL